METYLEHHGIKGQKWGVRRYQNEDGTLTEEGKHRLNQYKDQESRTLLARSMRVGNKIDKRSAKGKDTTKLERTQKQIYEEILRVGSMNINQMNEEKKRVAAAHVASALASIGTAGLNVAGWSPITMIMLPNTSGVKSRYRFSKNYAKLSGDK